MNFLKRTLFKIADITYCGTPYIKMEKANIKEVYDEVISDIPYLSKISPAYIQRRYKVNYDLASKVMELLGDNNIISPMDGAKPRDIIKNNL